MSNLLAEAINCDDGDQAARLIQQALHIESDDIANYVSRRIGRATGSSAPASLASGCRLRLVSRCHDVRGFDGGARSGGCMARRVRARW